MRTRISELAAKIDKTAEVAGFAQNLRKQSKIIFIELRDITGTIQIVVSKENEEAFKLASGCTLESVLKISGKVVKKPGSDSDLEIKAEKLEILSLSDPMLPIPVNIKTNADTDIQKRLDWRWLDIRKPENSLIFKVWTTMEASLRESLVKDDFIQIYSPKFMSAPSESGAELFAVPYFDTTAYLAQSPQFYKQMAMASGLEKVFEFGTVFRADPSFTARHATEFTGFDLEMSYIDSVEDVMNLHAKLLVEMIKKVKEAHGDEIKKDYDRELVVPELPFPEVTFTEAKEILKGLKVPNTKQSDLSPEEEKAISQYFYEKTGNEFLFVTDYPFAGRAFYSMRYDDNDLSKSFDLLWNGIEVSSGAQREHRYEQLKKNLEIKKVGMEHMQTYLDFFKFGCPPHGGFGNGPARLLMKMLGIGNIREVTYVYRGINRLDP